MTPLVFLAVAAAGGIGAGARFVLDGVIRSKAATRFPVGTMVINLTGSLALGLLAGLLSAAVIPTAVFLIVGTGFLGGYTTFSTASVETVRLLQARKASQALAHSLGSLIGGATLAWLGLTLGALIATSV